MKMRGNILKISCLTVFVLGLASCEREFEIKDVMDKPLFRIESIFHENQDTTEIVIMPTYPVTGDPYESRIPDGMEVHLFENGVERMVEKADDRFNDPKYKWFVTGGFQEDSKIEIIVKGEGYPSAQADITFPVKFNDFTCSVEKYTGDNAILNIHYKDNPETDDYYAVTVTHNVRTVLNDGTLLNENNSSVINDEYSKDDYGEYAFKCLSLDGKGWAGRNKLVFWNDAHESVDGVKTMSIHISEKKGADSWEYRGDQLGGEGAEVLGMCYSSSIVTVYRLTPQAYHYLCGQWNKELNVMADIGMAPPTFTYTNIVGGIGGFAAMSASDPYVIDWSGYDAQ